MEKISIIITTYHRDYQIIRNAIKSAISQTYPSIEIVLVDDNEEASSYSQKITEGIKEFSDAVRYLCYNGNKGACYARNYGVYHTDGELLAFLDDDDVWCPDKLKIQTELMLRDDYVLVSCNSYFVFLDINGAEYKRIEKIRTDKKEINLQDILKKNILGGCSFPLIQRKAFLDVGGFKEGLPSSQDYDLWIRLAIYGKIGHVNQVLLDYNIYQVDRISKNVNSKIVGYKYLIEQYSRFAEDEKRYKYEKYLTLGDFCFEHNSFRNGIVFVLKAMSKVNGLTEMVMGLKSISLGAGKYIKRSLRNKKESRK